ncbi:MAG TPA: hypothetical protein VLO13_03250 [Halomonas sp.]|nr:hypothetical protein [Halomonas sp.]
MQPSSGQQQQPEPPEQWSSEQPPRPLRTSSRNAPPSRKAAEAREQQQEPHAREQQQQPYAQEQQQQQPPATQPESSEPLTRRIKDLLKNDQFWENLQLLVDLCNPFVSLMRLADSNVPCMGKMYHRFYMLSQFVEAIAGDADAEAQVQEAHKGLKVQLQNEQKSNFMS